ncbi:TRAF3-interacting protein 1-like [Pyrus x bretschneideri]|uniref:TRAF3-interacting protein 1-like n=1 Tax=Pyrus x bretschneideri TaxID=225117 RepID=UPI00202FD0A6|nr:TRAF3-interacting protein 1-like [Pyrus x bretschneideri]XP_048435564.1 TRAF3-interacting protein 1-like [Pyrus x bretschneideri]XP_048435565.1 TRAF3-interacting protein 1-like [Pyrus x bretschneideri]
MSRCFPFPPPGYEKKARTDDVDLLNKEKHREKKPKKEKKDKEKRESTDKSDGKHREKKDKKEKKRDKKKDKEKDRDLVKDKISTSDEKRVPGKTEGHGEERCIQKEYKGNCFDKSYAGQIGGHQAEKLTQYHHLAEQNQNSVLVELGRRSKDEARATGNYLAEKITESHRKRDDILSEIKEKNKDRRVDDRRTDGQGVRGAAQVGGNTMVQNLVGMVEPKVEGLSRPLASNVDRKIDGKEKAKEKEGDDKRGEKRKDKDREKKKQGKDKDKDKQKKKETKAKEKTESKNGEPDKEKKKEAKAKEKTESKNGEPDKEKKKEEKTKEKNETKNAEPDKLRQSDKEDHIDSHSVVTSQLPKDSNKTAGTDGNPKKRKDIQTNGVVHANDIRPSKLLRPSSSSHSLLVNGRTLEPSQTSIPYVSDRLGAANNIKVDVKDCKINGIVEAPSLAVSTAKLTSTATQAVPVAEACMRPPHPDSRYLSHVYMVPKLDKVPDHDDQDWLFGCSDAQSKRPQVESSRVAETPEVWSEVLRIESADVHALPYVIPY